MSLERTLVRGSAWLALSYGGSQLVSLVVTAVLARLLAPSAFGLVSLAGIVLLAFSALQESGMASAVIHRREDIERSAASAYVFSLVSSLALAVVVVAAAPLAGLAFRQDALDNVLRVFALVLPLRAIGIIPGALIERELAFDRRAKGELSGALAQAATAVPLAFAGAGVWSLVVGQLVGAGVQSVIYVVVSPFKPRLRLASVGMMRTLGRYGRHVTAGNLVSIVDGNVDNVFAGRLFGATGVGYYALAWRLCNLPATGLSYIVGRVMFPVYATMQDDRPAFRDAFLANIRRVALLSLPVGIGILVAARPIVLAVFGGKWEPAVAPLRVLAVFGVIRSFAGSTGPVFQAAGRPQLVWRISLWHLLVVVVGLFALGRPYGLVGIASAVTVASFCSAVPSYWFALRILECSFSTLVRNLARPVACSLPVAVVLLVLVEVTRSLDVGVALIVAIVGGVISYACSTLVISRDELRVIVSAFRREGQAQL